jgi:general secretion pathway protein A
MTQNKLSSSKFLGTSSASAAPPTPPGEPGFDWPAGGDTDSALTALFAAWGLVYAPENGSACEQARQAGLHCQHRRDGDWARLSDMGLPAVLAMEGGDGHERHYAVRPGEMSGFRLLGNDGQALPREEVETRWPGEYLLLWRRPEALPEVMREGSRGEAVLWLRRRLEEAFGISLEAEDPSRFDAGLRRAVEHFQHRRGLSVDGIVGDKTLLHLLASEGAGPEAPAE